MSTLMSTTQSLYNISSFQLITRIWIQHGHVVALKASYHGILLKNYGKIDPEMVSSYTVKPV